MATPPRRVKGKRCHWHDIAWVLNLSLSPNGCLLRCWLYARTSNTEQEGIKNPFSSRRDRRDEARRETACHEQRAMRGREEEIMEVMKITLCCWPDPAGGECCQGDQAAKRAVNVLRIGSKSFVNSVRSKAERVGGMAYKAFACTYYNT